MEYTLKLGDLYIDPKVEHELRPSNKEGYRVIVEFGPKFGSRTLTFRNITEVHWKYPSIPSNNRVALESDIHSTGFTYDVADIINIVISEETEIAKEI